MLPFYRKAISRNSQSIGNKRLILLNSLIDRKGRSHILHHCAYADRQGSGAYLPSHHSIYKLLFSALRITLLQRLHMNVHVREFRKCLIHSLYRLRLVLFYANYRLTATQNLLHNGHADQNLLRSLQHYAIIAGKERLTFCSVDNQALSLAPRSRIKLHVGRESGSAKSHNSTFFHSVENLLPAFRKSSNKFRGKVYALSPLIALNCYLYVIYRPSDDIRARADRFYRTTDRRMHKGGDKSGRLSYDLAGFHLIPHCHHRSSRSPQVLSHRDIHSLRKRKSLYCTIPAEFGICRMDTTYTESQLTHCSPPWPQLQPL